MDCCCLSAAGLELDFADGVLELPLAKPGQRLRQRIDLIVEAGVGELQQPVAEGPTSDTCTRSIPVDATTPISVILGVLG